MVQYYVGSVIDAGGQVLHCAFAEFVDTEHKVVDVCNTIDVVFKDINAERMEQIYSTHTHTHRIIDSNFNH